MDDVVLNKNLRMLVVFVVVFIFIFIVKVGFNYFM